MKRFSFLTMRALLGAALILPSAQAASSGGAAETMTVRAVRVSRPPAVDGVLDDEAWTAAPEISGFTQHDPNDGQPATEKTVVKIVYTDDAIYFAARMDDSQPVTTLLGRREADLQADWFSVAIDCQHDRVNAAEFWVYPSNVQGDANVYDDIVEDGSWDAVWESATKIVPGGWVAEMRIPFSQLRFADRPQQTWGINFMRLITRAKERDSLVNVPKGEAGWVSHFADLAGVEDVRRERKLELLPYTVARSDLSSTVDSADPFARRSAIRADAGLDLKYALTSNLTLTGTINPDFGQVEVDPAVVNLTEYETFYPEKRPFFSEGAQIFRFGYGPARNRWSFAFSPPQFFYSRRIGRPPQASVAADFSDEPGQTTILGAAKLTGKIGSGWSLGVMDALTDREQGTFESASTAPDGSPAMRRWSQTVEPRTNYLVARAAKESGGSRIGILFASVNRQLDGDVQSLRRNAYELGADGYTQFRDKAWLLEWLADSTLVQGSEAAISSTERSPAHYYNRPDADYLRYDARRTSLAGFGGRAMLGKQTGKWRPNIQVQSYSPGFEVNDIGYMQRADVVNAHAVMMYLDQDVHEHTRQTQISFGKYDSWNYGADHIADGVFGAANVQTSGYATIGLSAGMHASTWDDRATRGGPVVRRPGGGSLSASFASDSRRKLSFSLTGERDQDHAGGWMNTAGLSMNFRPTTALQLSIEPSWTRTHAPRQYVTQLVDAAATATYGRRYIFGEMEEHVVDAGVRVDWTFSPRLSLQLYAQPFLAHGRYHDYKELARPRSDDYTPLGDTAVFDASANSWAVTGGGSNVTFANPDFNMRSARGSMVARWEFRPGSALYLVWNENRNEVLPLADFRFGRDFGAISDTPSQDVFLVKFSYWLPR